VMVVLVWQTLCSAPRAHLRDIRVMRGPNTANLPSRSALSANKFMHVRTEHGGCRGETQDTATSRRQGRCVALNKTTFVLFHRWAEAWPTCSVERVKGHTFKVQRLTFIIQRLTFIIQVGAEGAEGSTIKAQATHLHDTGD